MMVLILIVSACATTNAQKTKENKFITATYHGLTKSDEGFVHVVQLHNLTADAGDNYQQIELQVESGGNVINVVLTQYDLGAFPTVNLNVGNWRHVTITFLNVSAPPIEFNFSGKLPNY